MWEKMWKTLSFAFFKLPTTTLQKRNKGSSTSMRSTKSTGQQPTSPSPAMSQEKVCSKRFLKSSKEPLPMSLPKEGENIPIKNISKSIPKIFSSSWEEPLSTSKKSSPKGSAKEPSDLI